MSTRTRGLCQGPSLEVSTDLWVLHPCRIWCWSSFHGFWCILHFDFCFPVCPHRAATLSSHLISPAGGEMCPAHSQQLPCLHQSQIITGKLQVSHGAGGSKSCLQSSVVGHHLHFLSVSNKSAQFSCQNDSSNPSARRKCPGTHSGRTNHSGLGSAIITSCNKIPSTSCCSCQTHPQPLFCARIAQLELKAQTGGRAGYAEGSSSFHCFFPAEKMELLSRAELILQSGGENIGNHLYFFSPPTEQT